MTYRVAFKLIGDNDAVADIVQDVFVDLYDKLKHERDIKHYSSWLYKVTYNNCIDHLKKQAKHQPFEPRLDQAVFDKDFDSNDKQKIISNALNKLKENERFLAVLYSEGLNYKEMSEVTGIKFESIGKTLSRILKKLEKELKTRQYELFE